MVERIQLSSDGTSLWAGMRDCVLISPNERHELTLLYRGEPPHGDSFHEARINGVKFPGLIWGCKFASTSDSRFIAASWMPQPFERRTIVIDIEELRYFVLPIYIYDFTLSWPVLHGIDSAKELSFEFDGSESWLPF